MEQGHFAIAFEGLKWTDPDIFSLMLCQSLLGTYDAKRGGSEFTGAKLASDLAKMDTGIQLMQPFCTCYNDTGLFGGARSRHPAGPCSPGHFLAAPSLLRPPAHL